MFTVCCFRKVSSVYIIKDLSKWDKLIKEHDKTVLKYENAKVSKF